MQLWRCLSNIPAKQCEINIESTAKDCKISLAIIYTPHDLVIYGTDETQSLCEIQRMHIDM